MDFVMMGNLPLMHSFYHMVELWYLTMISLSLFAPFEGSMFIAHSSYSQVAKAELDYCKRPIYNYEWLTWSTMKACTVQYDYTIVLHSFTLLHCNTLI